MSYTAKSISEVISEYLNRHTFLPSIQREFVWEPYRIEKLFDSIMGEFPISSFLFWKIREEFKKDWSAYEFIRDFDKEEPHNKEANMDGINQDIYLVLDGQQRLTSINIGLKGSYRFFYYRWHKTKLFLNLLKEPIRSEDPEELTYQFEFREDDVPNPKNNKPQYWYLVGNILNFDDSENAKAEIKTKLATFTDQQINNANVLIGRLHSRIHTSRLLNYYEEKSQDFDKVVEVFIRANTAGVSLGYSDILLSTATAKWKTINAREAIHDFTDELNAIGAGYSFGKDFVLKGCLYLTEGLPIQYKVKNFTKTNLEKIEDNWETIKECLINTVKLVSKFGYLDKNLVSKIALLPIALYLRMLNKPGFVASTSLNDVSNQMLIQKWLAIVLLKNAFGSSSDTTLKNLQDSLNEQIDNSIFPYQKLNHKLGIESEFTDSEIDNLLMNGYSTKYSFLILSLLYPDRDWKDNKYHEDHIFPKSDFSQSKLKLNEIPESAYEMYWKYYNGIINLQLLTDSENLTKNAEAFETWLPSRDTNFKIRHSIPQLDSYRFQDFLTFIEERKKLIHDKLIRISYF